VSDINGDPLLESPDIRDGLAMAAGFTPTQYTNKYQERSSRYKYSQEGKDNDNINLRLAKAIKAKDQEKIRAIMKESADSMKSRDPADWKQVDMNSVATWMIPEGPRAIIKAPNKLKPGIKSIEDAY
jgi:hypothetical protein